MEIAAWLGEVIENVNKIAKTLISLIFFIYYSWAMGFVEFGLDITLFAEDEGFILFNLGNSPFLGKRVIKGNLSLLP